MINLKKKHVNSSQLINCDASQARHGFNNSSYIRDHFLFNKDHASFFFIKYFKKKQKKTMTYTWN